VERLNPAEITLKWITRLPKKPIGFGGQGQNALTSADHN